MAMKVLNDPVLAALHKKLAVRIGEYRDKVGDGVCKNFPEYTSLTGVIKGLEEAEKELLELDSAQAEIV